MKILFLLLAPLFVATIASASPASSLVPHPSAGLPPGAIGIGPGKDSLVISRDTTISADIYVVGAGKLIIKNAKLTMKGNIYAFDSAAVTGNGGSLLFPQDYYYQRTLQAVNRATIAFSHTVIDISNGNANAGIGEHAALSFHNVTFPDNFFTMGISGHSTLTVDSCAISGEYLFTDSSRSVFTNSGFIIAWAWISAGQVVDVKFPAAVVGHWAFPDSASQSTGVMYHMSFDGCKDVMWTVIHTTGASMTIHDSHVRAIGVFFTGSDSVAITGVANGATYVNDVFPDATRTLKLVNTTVDTWNYYPNNTVKLSLTNCVFGELLAANFSNVTVNTSVCDGTGGYFSATDSANIMVVSSTMRCAVISRMRSKITFVGGDVEPWIGGDQLTTERAGSIALFNTHFTSIPRAFDTSLVVAIGVLPPTRVGPGENVDLQGCASITAGPQSVVKFISYDLAAAPSTSGPWTTITPHTTAPVVNGSVGVWHVPANATGTWTLRIAVTHNFNDSIPITANVLVDPTMADVIERSMPASFQVFPNPVGEILTINNLEFSGPVRVALLNPLGRVVREAHGAGGIPTTIDVAGLPAGNYFLQTHSAAGFRTRMICKN